MRPFAFILTEKTPVLKTVSRIPNLFFGPIVCCLILGIWPSVVAQSLRPDNPTKSGDKTDFTIEQNFSGAEIIEKHTKLPIRRDLQTPCQAKRLAISTSLSEVETSLKSLEGKDDEPSWRESARLHQSAGQVLLYTGDVVKAIHE